MQVTIPHLAVSAIASAIPRRVVELAELSDLFGARDVNRIIKDTGIARLRVAAPEQCASDLCEAAARRALTGLEKEVGAIVFVTQTPDHLLPGTSTLLQHRLGLPESVAAFDLNCGCAGYLYGLYQAALLIHSGSCETVLVLAGDAISRFINPRDRSLRLLFGDAGTATVVQKGSGDVAFVITTDGAGAKSLMIPAGGSRYPRSEASGRDLERESGNFRSDDDLFMDGMEIMKFALAQVPRVIDALLALKGWAKAEVGAFGLHQANKFMLEYLARKMGLAPEAVPIAMGETGNTGPASIPLMLTLAGPRLAAEQRLTRTVLCGFGTGLSCAAAALDLSQTNTCAPIEV